MAEVAAFLPEFQYVKQILLVSIAGHQVGIDLKSIREVAVFEGLAPMPAVPRLFAGIAVLRGELIAAVNPALLWSDRPADIRAVTRLVVMGASVSEFALLAEKAEELRLVDEQKLNAPPHEFRDCPFVSGATYDGLIVIDGTALLEDPRIYAAAPNGREIRRGGVR
jgi:chemotaxis signal transduction protein